MPFSIFGSAGFQHLVLPSLRFEYLNDGDKTEDATPLPRQQLNIPSSSFLSALIRGSNSDGGKGKTGWGSESVHTKMFEVRFKECKSAGGR